MELFNGFRKSGTFKVASGAEVSGDLTLKGARTTLDLYSKEFFATHGLPGGCLLGSLHDMTKVSLIGCITSQGPGSGSLGDERYHFSTVFPHFVLFGSKHITAESSEITNVSFEGGDAHTLFYDFSAFGQVHGDIGPYMDKIVESERSKGREVVVGEHPMVFYFTGKHEIFKAETAIGTISAGHAPSYRMPGPRGIELDNKIRVNVVFNTPRTVDGAMKAVQMLLRFLEIMAGRPQNVVRLVFLIDDVEDRKNALDVYWSMRPPRPEDDDEHGPSPTDLPVQAAREPEMFANILTRWIARDQEWHSARARFSKACGEQHSYSIDRLVGAANMFDILPSSAVPSDVPLTAAVEQARDKARGIFKALNVSPERDSVLNTLGRIGKASLKRKIRERAAPITRFAGSRFPELELVIDEAVNCRNYFVHGSAAKMDYTEKFDQVVFFTDALEFVFAASDLVESGWNIALWSQKMSTLSHPFDRFLKNYGNLLGELKRVLAEAAS